MKNLLVILTIALSLGCSTSVGAEIAATDNPVDATVSTASEKALNLVKQQYSADKIINQVSGVLDKTLPQSLVGDPQFAELEAAYPGLAQVIAGALKPVMLEAYTEKMPLLWDQLAELYVANLTSAEIGQANAFSTSQVGLRYAEALRQSQNMRPVLDAVRKADGVDKTVEDASRKAQLNAIRQANLALSAADRIAIFRFENSVAGSKIAKMMPQMQDIVLKWDFYFTDRQKAAFVDARTTAIREFIAKSDGARAEATSKTVAD